MITKYVVEDHKKLAKRNCKVIIAFRTTKSSPKSVSDLCSQIKVNLTFVTGSKIYFFIYRRNVTVKTFLLLILIFQVLNQFEPQRKNWPMNMNLG